MVAAGTGATLARFGDAWRNYRGLLFTAADHARAAHSFTAVLPYARLVSLREHQQSVRALTSIASRAGSPFDAGAWNSARFAYLPGTVPGRPFEAHDLGGSAMVEPRELAVHCSNSSTRLSQ